MRERNLQYWSWKPNSVTTNIASLDGLNVGTDPSAANELVPLEDKPDSDAQADGSTDFSYAMTGSGRTQSWYSTDYAGTKNDFSGSAGRAVEDVTSSGFVFHSIESAPINVQAAENRAPISLAQVEFPAQITQTNNDGVASQPVGPASGNPATTTFQQVASKLGGQLATLALAPAGLTNGLSAEPATGGSLQSANDLTIVGDMVAIDASSISGDIEGLLAQLEGLGLQFGSTWGNTLSGLIPVSALAEASLITDLNQARGAMASSNVGAVANQADVSMNSDDARATFGIDGTGVSIGVMSDSYDNLGGEAADIASGDLPDDVNVLLDLGSGGIDEGRAMLQLIHDVAPGASLSFYTAFLGQASFANGIQALIAAGADIVVDDIFYFAEPFFQDGVITQSADLAVQNGTPYFTSAGNSGSASFVTNFSDSGLTKSYTNQNAVGVTNAQLHDFDPGAGVDTRLSFTFAGTTATGGTINRLILGLQWDEPFSSVAAASGGAVSDYDILLTDNSGNIIANLTASSSTIGGDPNETLSINYTGFGPFDFNIEIARASGATDNLLKAVAFRSTGLTQNEFVAPASTTVGHSNSALAQSVAAAYYLQTPEFGVDPAVAEAFSSLGNTPILFDVDGNRLLTPEIRQSPDITAPDGTDTTFFGSDSDGSGFPNFFGTSAAAPHAAAVAALLLDRNPNATPQAVFDAMTSTALDMNTPGVDYLTGAGLVQADLAVAALGLDDVLFGTGGVDALNGYEGADILVGYGGDDTLDGGSEVDRLFAGAGNDTLFGGAGNDTASGGAGNDIFRADWDAGNDVFDGGAGSDRLAFNTTVGGVTVNMLAGTASGSETGNDMFTGIENVVGGLGNDVITPGADVNTINAIDGIDTLDFSSLSTQQNINLQTNTHLGAVAQGDTYLNIENVNAGSHDDALAGDGNDNRLVGNGGNDTLQGRLGNDTLIGGAGNDGLYGGFGDDFMIGGAGGDFYNGGSGGESLGDTISYAGSVGVDVSLKDNLASSGDAVGDTFTLVENLFGSSGNDYFVGDTGANRLDGNLGNDTLYGWTGDDILNGDDGNDRIFGGAGTDIIRGGAGNDELRGNGDADIFVFADGFGTDTIFDFTNGSDTVNFAELFNIVDFTDLQTNHLTFNGSGNAVVTDGSDVLTIVGLTNANTDASDFVFSTFV